MLEVRNLFFSYGEQKVLKSINFSVEEGEFFSLVGPNGCGKTTLLKNVTGLLKPDRGKVRVGGKSLEDLRHRELARRVAMVHQENSVGFDFLVSDLVEMGRFPHLGRFEGFEEVDREALNEAVERTDIGSLRNRSIRELSGGEKQRVFLALALAQQPDLLVLDEPTSNLDISYQVKIMDTVRRLVDEGLTAVEALHDLNLAANYSDRLGLLSDGGFASCGRPAEVLIEEDLERVYNVEVNVSENGSNRLHIYPEGERKIER